MDRLTVAAAQVECRPGDVAANLALHIETIRDARAGCIDLLVFPELSLTDYLPQPDVRRLARTPDAPEIRALADAAGEMLVSFGFIEEHDGRFHNAQALVSNGRVLHIHRKLNLPTYGRLTEGLHYAKGERIELVAHSGWSVATLVCAEAWNPALPWLAALKGATFLLVPVASSLHVVEALDKNPRLAEILNALSAKLDDATMAKLNASVDVDKKTVEEVAAGFLKGQGLV